MLETLTLSRHAHAASNVSDVVNGVSPGEGLSPTGVDEARALGVSLAAVPVEVGISSTFLRTQQTLALALGGRDVPLETEPLIDEIGFGSFEGGPLSAYLTWAWANEPHAVCPGGGETRVQMAARLAAALAKLLARPEREVLVVSHGLPLRYILDAAEGAGPARRVGQIPYATPYRLARAGVERAAESLTAWVSSPCFVDDPPRA